MMARLVLVMIALLVLALPARAEPLPEPWRHGWLGAPQRVGNAWHDKANGRFCMWASSGDIWENADSAYFTYRFVKGDFTLTARLHEGLSFVDPWAKGGLMVRSAMSADAKNTAILITARNGIFRQLRGLDGAGTDAKAMTPPAERTIGTYLRLSRGGNTIRMAWSKDGVEWSPNEEVQLELPEEALVGFVWATHNINNQQIVAFNDIKLDDKKVSITDAERADLAEARLRPKDNTLYPPVHTAGPMRARRASEFIDSIGLTTHIHDIRGSPRFSDIVKPALLETGIRYIRDGGFEPPFFDHITELGRLGVRYTANMVPRANLTAAEQVEREVLPIIDALVAVEGPNEPDIMPWFANYKGRSYPEGVRLYQKELYEAIKGHKDERVRKLMVLSPPLAHPHVNGSVLGPMPCDAVNLHMYQGGALPDDQWATKWKPGADHTASDRPIVITETGYHFQHEMAGQPGISERAGARYVPRLFLDMFNLGVLRTHYYNLSTDGWGDLREDGTLRPSLLAVKNLVELLSEGPEVTAPPEPAAPEPAALPVTLSGNVKDLRHLLLQKRNGTYYLVLWLNRYSWDYDRREDLFPAEQQVVLTFDAPVAARLYRPLATTRAIRTWAPGKSLEVFVPDHPLVLEIGGR
jgi:regulation of enolase protein 1 (concanavalin A-like superfamily)